MRKIVKKKGVSPVIATVLLISIAIALALLIFLWAKSVVKEKLEKFGEPVENACDDIAFEAEAFGSELSIVNEGSVALYGVDIKKKGIGSVDELQPFAESGERATILQGETVTVDLPAGLNSGDEILVVPVILGETGSYKKAHICDTNFGKEIALA